jgi:hypothetical protein
VWLYYRFPLSFREVEEMMMACGVLVTYETIRGWCHKLGQTYANGLRRRRLRRSLISARNLTRTASARRSASDPAGTDFLEVVPMTADRVRAGIDTHSQGTAGQRLDTSASTACGLGHGSTI